ncbi:MAG: DUF488 family protein, N3 subclade [Streptosporangiaceae bacterium]
MGTDIGVRRVYEDPSPADGARVLVDRVWPRGTRKDLSLSQAAVPADLLREPA